jgi:hypothetical protein
MSDEADERVEIPPPPAAPPVVSDGDAGEPLDHIIDDSEPRREAATWADEAILAGAAPEELVERLSSNGWDSDEAEQIVEAARVRTRRARGVLTRDDVAREMGARYSKGMRTSWFAALPTLSSAWRLMISIGNLLTFRRWRGK